MTNEITKNTEHSNLRLKTMNLNLWPQMTRNTKKSNLKALEYFERLINYQTLKDDSNALNYCIDGELIYFNMV